ncbi:hypothetical protein Tsubulata_018158 [Turnera subulata]|uniref:Uncharacterized protein n=1 Tax=Turnera subulata TaxID=218843 RepID=A0A9Q0FZV4_9ROSI|nr:hypothetical protein Tsubulata_018158 [Turnera subulata]
MVVKREIVIDRLKQKKIFHWHLAIIISVRKHQSPVRPSPTPSSSAPPFSFPSSTKGVLSRNSSLKGNQMKKLKPLQLHALVDALKSCYKLQFQMQMMENPSYKTHLVLKQINCNCSDDSWKHPDKM